MKCNKWTLGLMIVAAISMAFYVSNSSSSVVLGQESQEDELHESELEEVEEWDDEESDDEESDEYAHHDDLELELIETEIHSARIEQLAEAVNSQVHTSAFTIDLLVDRVEPEVAIEILQASLENTTKPAISRLIRLHLVHLYDEIEQFDAAKKLATELISGSE